MHNGTALERQNGLPGLYRHLGLGVGGGHQGEGVRHSNYVKKSSPQCRGALLGRW